MTQTPRCPPRTGVSRFPIDGKAPEGAPGRHIVSRSAEPHGRGVAERHGVSVAIIEDRILLRDSVSRGIAAVEPSIALSCHASVEAFAAVKPETADGPQVALLCTAQSKPRSDCFSQIARLRALRPSVEVVVLGEAAGFDDVVGMIERGARGCISTRLPIEIAAKAVRLVAAGGIYLPEDVLTWLRQAAGNEKREPAPRPEGVRNLTPQQMAVAAKLCCGMSNKIIAHKLGICESTVKIHVRNIMKKLKVNNRTTIVYVMNQMQHEDASNGRGAEH